MRAFYSPSPIAACKVAGVLWGLLYAAGCDSGATNARATSASALVGSAAGTTSATVGSATVRTSASASGTSAHPVSGAPKPKECTAIPEGARELASINSAAASAAGAKFRIVVAAGTPHRISREGEETYEHVQAELWAQRADDSCLLARAKLGEVTRLQPAKKKPVAAALLALTERPLGAVKPLMHALAVEQVALPDKETLLVVHHFGRREWNLDERWARPFVWKDAQLVSGDSVRVGRDSTAPPTFYGWFSLDTTTPTPSLVLHREGRGDFSPRTVLQADAKGAFRSTPEAEAAAATQPVGAHSASGAPAAVPPRGHVAPASDEGSKARPLAGCGKEFALQTLQQLKCPDGGKPAVKHLRQTAPQANGRPLDVYGLTCGAAVREVFVDLRKCHRGRR